VVPAGRGRLDGRQALTTRMRPHMKGNAMSSRVPTWQSDLRATPIRRRTVLLSGAALPLGLLIGTAKPAAALQPTPPARLTLPTPTGRRRLGTTSLYLVDPSRPDPWVPSQRVRQLMIQLWYPADAVDDYPRAPYMTPITARAYEKIMGLPSLNWPITEGHLGAPVHQRRGGWPVVMYSHSLGGERFETTSLVEDLASHGYAVVTIDHVHDADVVVLPDGNVETCAVPPPTEDKDTPVTTKEIVSRVADVRFVLDQLAVINRGGNPGHEPWPLPRGLCGALDLGRVGLFGQSDGGSTTVHAMNVDARIKVGVDLDGTLWTPQAVAGSDHPLLLFGRQDLDPFEAATWAEFWTKQRGPKLWLNLKGSTHGTFTDFAPLLPQVAPILGEPPSWVIKGAGTINGQRAVAIQRAYIGAYFDTYLRHHGSSLLSGPSPSYPEVVFAH
jgi:Platelet-activating factor acetylhydrolase, isoform II